jgi:hypothetical protein
VSHIEIDTDLNKTSYLLFTLKHNCNYVDK